MISLKNQNNHRQLLSFLSVKSCDKTFKITEEKKIKNSLVKMNSRNIINHIKLNAIALRESLQNVKWTLTHLLKDLWNQIKIYCLLH